MTTATIRGAASVAPITRRADGAPDRPVDGSNRMDGRQRNGLYDEIANHHMAPLWEKLRGLVSKEPESNCIPYVWRFEIAKRLMLAAGDFITAEDAMRRVLILENPGMPGKGLTTNTLLGGIQLILPGEIAPSHLHAATAVRFVLDGEGAYTQVDGERCIMRRGDFVVTPSLALHDHGNISDQPVIWLDVLDLPMMSFFEAGFFQHVGRKQESSRDDGDSLLRYGSGAVPEGTDTTVKYSPIVSYPYARMRPILRRLAQAGDVDPRHGVRIRYANPFNGGWVTPTIGSHLALLPAGFMGRGYRSTDATIFACVEGKGVTTVGSERLGWTAGDVFIVPGWKRHWHSADQQAVLFSLSDRPAQQALGIWREEE